MTDREILELLLKGQNSLENKLDTLKAQFDEHEAKDANRHIELMEEIKALRKDVGAIETITAKNWQDITHLKAIK